MTSEQQTHYDRYEKQRNALPLPKGMRYLTTDDSWQLGDEYDGLGREPQSWNIWDGTPRWWKVGSKHTGVQIGDYVGGHYLCYTPRGWVKREKV